MEIINRFRRSKLGILWVFVSPLLLTAIMSVVFGTVFRVEVVRYAPYILSGLLVWDVIVLSLVGGSFSIIQNDPYIRQYNHPVLIYTLKSSLVSIFLFLLAMVSLELWVGVLYPQNLLIGFLTLPLTALILFCFAWACTTISALTATKYRDYPQIMPLLLQIVWYISPVFFQEEMFAKNRYLYLWFQYNPITHILFLVRKPFLEGKFPEFNSYVIVFITFIFIGSFAIYIYKKNAKNIIFYI